MSVVDTRDDSRAGRRDDESIGKVTNILSGVCLLSFSTCAAHECALGIAAEEGAMLIAAPRLRAVAIFGALTLGAAACAAGSDNGTGFSAPTGRPTKARGTAPRAPAPPTAALPTRRVKRRAPHRTTLTRRRAEMGESIPWAMTEPRPLGTTEARRRPPTRAPRREARVRVEKWERRARAAAGAARTGMSNSPSRPRRTSRRSRRP